MRAGADRGKLGLRSFPSSESIADRIFANGEFGLAAELLDELAAAHVGFGEDDSGRDRRGSIRNISQRVEFGRQSELIDLKQAGAGSNPYREDISRVFSP